MKLSIVMSVHNKAHYMDAFVSLTRRNAPGVELVLVDDGSTDGTGDILKRHADVFIRTEDIWEVKANNAGLRAATGDVVAIIQDDDLILADDGLLGCADFMQTHGIHILGGRGIGRLYFRYGFDEPLNERALLAGMPSAVTAFPCGLVSRATAVGCTWKAGTKMVRRRPFRVSSSIPSAKIFPCSFPGSRSISHAWVRAPAGTSGNLSSPSTPRIDHPFPDPAKGRAGGVLVRIPADGRGTARRSIT